MSFTEVDPLLVEAQVLGAVLDFATPPVPYPTPDDEPGWSARVVDMFGTVLAELPYVNVRSVGLELNRPNTAVVEVPKGLAPVDLLPPNEIQVWRNGQILFWGPATRLSADSGSGAVTVACQDPQWYFERAFFGTAERLNKLINGGFETGDLTGWGAVGITADVVDTGAVARGDYAAVLYGRSQDNAYITQTQVFQTDFPFGMRVHVSAWCHISAGDWAGETQVEITDQEHGTRLVRPGLMVIRRTYPGGEIERIAVAEITEETPRGRWVRLDTAYTVSPGQLGTIEVRLYGVNGTIRWDEARVSVPESTSGDPDGTDQAELVRRIVVYRQSGRGKSNVNVGTNTPATGVIIPHRAWQHADHEPIMAAIREFTESDTGLDVHVEITPHTRTFTTHYPYRGADRSGSLTLSTASNVASFGYDHDVERTANSVVVLGPAEGPTREEGGAINPDALPGGLILEQVVTRLDLEVGQLDRVAAEMLALSEEPVQVVEAVVHDRSLIGVLDVGDLVSVDLDDGIVQVSGVWRVVRAVIDARTDTIRATLNRWALETGQL